MATRGSNKNRENTTPRKAPPPKAEPHDEAKEFARQLEAVRLTIKEARVIAEETAGDDEVMERALARMVQTHLFTIMQKLRKVEDGSPRKKLPDIHAIARTHLCSEQAGN